MVVELAHALAAGVAEAGIGDRKGGGGGRGGEGGGGEGVVRRRSNRDRKEGRKGLHTVRNGRYTRNESVCLPL